MKAKILSIITGLALAAQAVDAANIIWTNTGGSAFLQVNNWNGAVPGANDVAQFGVNPTGSSTIGIAAGTSNNLFVGAIEVTSNRTSSLIIGNSSSTTAGTLTLNGQTINGTNNVILHNASGNSFTVRDDGGGNKLMNLALGNATENIVLLDGSGNIVIADVIKSSSGTTPLTFAGAGSGRVDVNGLANTFTGAIKLTGAEVRFGGAGSFGDVNNTIVIDGGRLSTSNSASFTLASTHAIQVSAASGTSISTPGAGVLTYNGVISDKPGTTGSWAKQGGGTLQLGGVSTYSGDTAINNGILQLTLGNNRLPTGTTVSLGQSNSGNLSTFDLNGFNQEIAGLNSVAGDGTGTTNGIRNTVTSSVAATLTLSGTNNYSYGTGTTNNSGQITGAIKLVKTGTGTQTLGEANSYTGGTVINGGELDAAIDASLGAVPGSASNNITLDGGRLSTISGSNLTINANRNILLGSTSGTSIGAKGGGNTLTYNGVLKDKDGSTQGILVKQGQGILALGGVSTYTGRITINNGTLKLTTGNNRLPTGTQVNFNQDGSNFGILDLNGFNQEVAGLDSDPGVGNTNRNTVTSATAATLTLSGTNTYSYGTMTTNETGCITGAIKLVKTGTGSQTLGDANSYNGGTVVNGGSLIVASDASLGAVPGSASDNITVDGGRLSGISDSNLTINTNRNILLGSTAGGAISAPGSAAVLTYNGVFKDKDGSTQGMLVKQGAGMLALGGVSSYTGHTMINHGTLELTTGNNRLPIGTTLSLGEAGQVNLGTFDLNGFDQEVAGLNSVAGLNATPNKNTVTSSSTAMLTLGGSGTYSYGDGSTTNSGQITGAVKIVKNGAGEQTFGETNTYGGGTTINGGTLVAANNDALGSGGVTVSGGALKLRLNVNVGNTKTLAGGSFKKDFASGEAFSNFGIASSSLGGHDTTFSFLGGKASVERDDVTTDFSLTILSAPSNDGERISDIFNLSGTAADIFVLELQVTGVSSNSFLGWASGGQWVNAVNGNDATGSAAVTNYSGAFNPSWAATDSTLADHLGSWGYDISNNAVWAVLDHNSDFAVIDSVAAIPEPSAATLLALVFTIFVAPRLLRQSYRSHATTALQLSEASSQVARGLARRQQERNH